MKSRAGAFLKAGGLPIATGTGGGTTGSGGSTGTGGATSTGGGGARSGGTTGSGGTTASGDSAQYNFESGSQGWVTSGGMLVSDQSSTDRAFAGTHSLKVNINGAAGKQTVKVPSPTVTAGKLVTFHIWIPSGSAISALQPYALQGASGGWTWTGAWRGSSQLTAGQWNTITVQLPSNAATPLAELGVEVTTNATYTGAMYLDAVSW